MIALTLEAPREIVCREVQSPVLESPHEALIRVGHAALCGSDLHPYRGHEKGFDPGTIMGHDFVGETVTVGSQVTNFAPGQRVFSPFTTCCGACDCCSTGLTSRCSKGQLLGWVEQGAGLQGAQAEMVRIPLADSTLLMVPDGVSDEVSLLLGDNLSTGYYGALRSEIEKEQSCAVVGCGTVGLLAVLCCRELGADPVYAIDPVASRRTRAEAFGGTPLAPQDAQSLCCRSVVEAVGNLEALRLAYELTAPGGTLASVGVHTSAGFAFSPAELYDKNLTYRSGRCPARALAPQLLDTARAHSSLLEGLFTHTFPLSRGAEAYRLFDQREDGCQKVLIST